MSPIAVASYKESLGREVKGSGRHRNGSPRPSVLALLATTGTIESLAEMRGHIDAGVASGEIAPAVKTLEAWRDAIWVRVFELMALQPRRAPFIYNVTLRWPKPEPLQRALEAAMREVTKPLAAPTVAERANTADQRRSPE